MLAISTLSAGCVFFPVRMSPQVQGRGTVSADLTFIKEGQTSRQEFLQRMGWADVGLNDNRIFWGRWRASSSGTVVIFLIPGAVGGQRDRNWHTQNVLVEFNEKDVVSRVMPKVKDKNIVRELMAWSQRSGHKPANPSSIRNSFAAFTNSRNGSMYVKADSLDFSDHNTRLRFTVPREKISSLKLKSETDIQPSYTLGVEDKTPWGKKIHLGISPPELLPILAYITPRGP